MDNFLKFIEEDIEAKKTLISTLPTKTKANKKKYNDKINLFLKKYTEYQDQVKKYTNAKSKKFNVQSEEIDLEKVSSNVNNLERVKFILNPSNTFFEKMGFDNLIYEISNYNNISFESLNRIICEFVDKFELAGINLTKEDFNYTYFVYEYMTSFLEERKNKTGTFDNVAKVFERIYWVNPEIIQHIELNLRKLVNKYKKKFILYIESLSKELKSKYKISNYKECADLLEAEYFKLEDLSKENIVDIIELIKNNGVDINNFFEDSKFRVTSYNSLVIDSLNFDNKDSMDKFYSDLEKLKDNLIEYKNYAVYKPLFNSFKSDFEKLIGNTESDKNIKKFENDINTNEKKLEKINKKIFNDELDILEGKKRSNNKNLKIASIKKAEELYVMYKNYDELIFKKTVLSILNTSTTISDILHLFYSFDYFKKKYIKNSLGVENNEDLKKHSTNFDLFAMNPTNVIIKGIPLFENSDVDKIIVNRYRLYNINLNSELLDIEMIDSLIEQINYLLRINIIEKSSLNVEKLWFISKIHKMSITK